MEMKIWSVFIHLATSRLGAFDNIIITHLMQLNINCWSTKNHQLLLISLLILKEPQDCHWLIISSTQTQPKRGKPAGGTPKTPSAGTTAGTRQSTFHSRHGPHHLEGLEFNTATLCVRVSRLSVAYSGLTRSRHTRSRSHDKCWACNAHKQHDATK